MEENMRKNLISTLICALLLCGTMALSVFAATTPISVPKATPTIDGEIDALEWNRDNYIEMDSSNCQAWAGEIIDKVTFYYYWDDSGLYCAAKVIDEDVNLCYDGDSPYTLDCFQIALNPGNLIDGVDQGILFSIGVTDNGNVEEQRHNYEDGLITENCVGKGKTNDDGWQLELLIPWDQINVLDTKFTPEVGYKLDAIICLLDRDDGGGTTNAFKTVLPDGDVNDFTVASYALTLTLEEEKAAEEVLAIEEEAAPAEAAPAEAPAETPAPVAEAAAPAPAPAPQTSDVSGILILTVTAALSCAVIVKKRLS